MDFNEFRFSGIERFSQGDNDQLTRHILENDLNRVEREFLAELVRNNIPKNPRGPKPNSLKPVKAALIRFWRGEVEGWTKKDAIHSDIASRLGISTTMARKYLQQIDCPKTEGDKNASRAANHALFVAKLIISTGNAELIELQREEDLKPISEK